MANIAITPQALILVLLLLNVCSSFISAAAASAEEKSSSSFYLRQRGSSSRYLAKLTSLGHKLNGKIDNEKSTIARLKEERDQLKDQVTTKRQECKPLSRATNKDKKEFLKAERGYSDKMKECRNLVDATQEERNQCKNAVKEEKKTLKSTFNTAKGKSHQCQAQLKTLVQEFRNMKQRLQNRKKALKKLQKRKRKHRKRKKAKSKVEVTRELVAGQCVADHVCAAVRGDPHIATFDGLKYDCQGEGEFILAKSLNPESSFEIQARFVSIGKPSKTVSVTKAVSITTGVEGEPDIDIFTEMEDGVCNLYYYVDGEPTDFTTHVPGISFEGNGDNSTDKADYLFFTNSGIMYTVYAKQGNFRCVLNSKICLPPSMIQEEDIVGLLGTPDGIKTNEWTTPSGANLGQSNTKRKAGYAMCTQNWCVRNADDSIFGYLEGTQHSDYMNCDAPYDESGDDYILNPPDECEECCANHPMEENYDECVEECAMADEGFGVEQCIIDIEDAVVLADVEKKCQDPVVPEEPERSGGLDPAAAKEESDSDENEEAATGSSNCMELDGGFEQVAIDGETCFSGSSAAVTCACNDPALGKGTCCQGELACVWPNKNRSEVTVCVNSCNGDKACYEEKKQRMTIHEGSCNKLRSCYNIGQGSDFRKGSNRRCQYNSCDKEVGKNSCNGEMACSNARGEVGNGSCDGLMSCMFSDAMIGHNACTEDHACRDADEDVQDNTRRLL